MGGKNCEEGCTPFWPVALVTASLSGYALV